MKAREMWNFYKLFTDTATNEFFSTISFVWMQPSTLFSFADRAAIFFELLCCHKSGGPHARHTAERKRLWEYENLLPGVGE